MSESPICLNARSIFAETEQLKERYNFAYDQFLATGRATDKEWARAMGKLLNNKIEELERIILLHKLEKIQIDEQYTSQVALLSQAKFAFSTLRPDASEEKLELRVASGGIDRQAHLLPKISEIIAHMSERSGFIRGKIEQGFTRLLLVPMAPDLHDTVEKFGVHLVRCQEQRSPALSRGSRIYVDRSNLYNVATLEDKFVYQSQTLGVNHRGKSKEQQLAEMRAADAWSDGWQILLVRPDEMEQASESHQSSPKQFLERIHLAQEMSEDTVYFGEEVMTLEAWMVDFMTRIAQAAEPLKETDAVLVGNYSIIDATVPRVRVTPSSSKIVFNQMDINDTHETKYFPTVVKI